MIQSGNGYYFLAAALGVLIAAYRTYTTGRSTWWMIWLGLLGAGIAYYLGTDEELRTLTAIQTGKEGGVADPGGRRFDSCRGRLLHVGRCITLSARHLGPLNQGPLDFPDGARLNGGPRCFSEVTQGAVGRPQNDVDPARP